MPETQITLGLEKAELRILEQAFPDKESPEEIATTICSLALAEWLDWFAARSRPVSLSDLARERVQRIFEHPSLYADRQVTSSVLFNQFNVPYGQAVYLERVFADRDQPQLVKKSLELLVSELETDLKTWSEDEDADPDQSFSVEVDKLGQRVLQALMQEAKAEGVAMAPQERALAVRGYYNYTFTSDSAAHVVEAAKDRLKRYK